jgi:hypothetical protein
MEERLMLGCTGKVTVALFVGSDVSSHMLARQLVPALHDSGFGPLVYFPLHRAKPAPLPELRELAFFEREVLTTIVDAPVVEDVNAPSFIAELDAKCVDVGISIRCYQKVRRPLIEFFSRRGAACLWNLHPGILPMYRGVMTVFRSMLEAQGEIGYTLHIVDETWDGGPIIDVRCMPLTKTKAMLTSYCELAPLGVPLILDALQRYRDGTIHATPQDPVCARYHTFPTRAEMDAFLGRGCRLVDREEVRPHYLAAFSIPGVGPDAALVQIIDDAIAECDRD